MPERGGPTTQSGIFYQNTVAALYLGRLLDPLPRRDADRVVEVRVEAPTDVDDTVVTFADGHRVYVQSKENIRETYEAWGTLWEHFAAQCESTTFQKGIDRLLLHIGEIQEEHHALRELCDRAHSSRVYDEWWARLTQRQQTLVNTIKPFLGQAAPGEEALLDFFRHVDVEIVPLTELERTRAPLWTPESNQSRDTLFRLLRDRVVGEARRRGIFTADPLRRTLEADNDVQLAAAPSIDELKVAARSCGALLRLHKATIGGTGRHVPRQVVSDIVTWIGGAPDEQRVAMLLDGAGMGKTVVMRDVLNALERQDTTVLAIRADQQLSGIGSYDELPARLHLPDSVERVVAGLAAAGPVAVLIDQIDALSLSLAHDQKALDVVLDLVARIGATSTARILLSCRTFDRNSDPRLRRMAVEREFALAELEEDAVHDVVHGLGIDYSALSPATRKLLRVPLHLDLFALVPWGQATDRSDARGITSLQALYALLWRDVVLKADPAGPPASERIEILNLVTAYMDREQRISAPRSLFTTRETAHLERAVNWLASAGILVAGATEWTFLHQTFFDYCYAQRFVEGGRHLAATVLQGDQGLFARPQLIQVLSYLRGHDPGAYLRELNALLAANGLRFHLRDLLLRWFGALPDPTDAEWILAQRLLFDAATRPHLLGAMQGNAAWFARVRGATLQSLFAQHDQTVDAQVLPYLSSLLEVAQADVITAVRPYLRRGEWWINRLGWWLASGIRTGYTPEAIDLLEELLRAMPTLNPNLIYALDDIAESAPRAACRLMGLVLDRVLDRHLVRRAAEPESGYFPLGHELEELNGSTIDRALAMVGRDAPTLFVATLVPWIERALAPTAEQPHYYATDDLSHAWHDGIYVVQQRLITILVEALTALARAEPAEFRRIAARLAALPYKSPQHLLALVYRAVPDQCADDALQFLLADRRRLDLGEHQHHDTRQLITAIYPYLSADQRTALEEYILRHTRILRVLGVDGLRRRGLDTLYLLQAIPGGPTTEPAIQRLRELERKFPGLRAAEGRIVPMGGFVGPPIAGDAAARMSDRAWLRAMRKYRGAVQHREFLKGGARELAGVLADQVKADPGRFYRLAMRVPDDTDVAYIEAFVTGLAESGASAKCLFAVVRRFGNRTEHGMRATIARALEKRVEEGLPNDLIDVLDGYVRDEVPDPWEDNRDPYSAYLNSDRGAAFHTLMRALDRQGTEEAKEREWASVEYTATNGSTALRAGAIERLLYVLHDDRDRAVARFEQLMVDHPTLLRSHYTQEFLYYGMYQRFGRLERFIRALMGEVDEKDQQRGAELACIAALAPHAVGSAQDQTAAQQLGRETTSGRAAWRRGTARIYAGNMASDTSGACERELHALLDDDDIVVRRSISDAFTRLRADHVFTARAFFDAYAASRSLADGRQRFAEYLWKHGLLEPAWVLSVVEIIVDNPHTSREAPLFAGGEDLVRLVLRVYTDPTADDVLRGRAMDLFDRLMQRYTSVAQSVLVEWDRR